MVLITETRRWNSTPGLGDDIQCCESVVGLGNYWYSVVELGDDFGTGAVLRLGLRFPHEWVTV